MYGRMIDPQRIDFILPKVWLDYCRTTHVLCNWRITDQIAGFRVINCCTREITTIQHDAPFIALSYLWGESLPGDSTGCEVLPTPAPQTVEDAIIVAINLGIPYLWVDRYCIDQSNAAERHHLIQNMDKIYRGADITIVAAAGTNPHYGLPGVSTTPRRPQPVLNTEQYRLVCVSNPRVEIESSLWHTRGWTFQEMMLSLRLLVFTDSQIYFQCTGNCFSETIDAWFPYGTLQRSDHYHPDIRAFPIGLNNVGSYEFYERLSEYYGRHLSFEADMLNAFSGIFAAFTDYRPLIGKALVHQFWGIPVFAGTEPSKTAECASFAKALTWVVDESSDVHYPVQRSCPEKRKGEWPSWTWASVKGGRLVSDFIRKGFQGQDDISITLPHQSSENVDIATYASQKLDSTHFIPAIDITSWVMSGVLISNNPDMWDIDGITGFPACLGKIHLDIPGSFTEPVTAIYLGGVDPHTLHRFLETDDNPFPSPWVEYRMVFLLVVEDEEARAYRRVGLWTDVTVPSWADNLGLVPTSESPPPWLQVVTFGEVYQEWKKKTLRIA
jgi:hypothetical protein